MSRLYTFFKFRAGDAATETFDIEVFESEAEARAYGERLLQSGPYYAVDVIDGTEVTRLEQSRLNG